ncbi:MAG: DotI/IcmL family type IV secretion protein [Gammaproteobacteria bacterium]|nr:DotI/IcmL family type IV secretion protein [Gammaproteobacteria bacterium]MCD8542048.1 DotI/IcmL family type IV secretion protein [Gammaproteobacteria bacterium]
MDEQTKKEHSSELTVPTPMFCNFYQDQYRRTVLTTAFAALMNLIGVFLIIFLVLEKPVDVYIPAEEASPLNPPSLAISDETITPRIAIDKPNFDDSELNVWLLKTLTELFTYNLQDYPTQLNRNQFYLLPEAQSEYLSILNDMAHLGDYTTTEVISSMLVAKAAPILYDQGLSNGRYYWIFDIPVEVSFSGSVQIPTQSMSLRLIIVRTSMENDVDGIKIASIQASNIRRGNNIIR